MPRPTAGMDAEAAATEFQKAGDSQQPAPAISGVSKNTGFSRKPQTPQQQQDLGRMLREQEALAKKLRQ